MRSEAMHETRIVLGPDVLARSFFDGECLRVLELWRDGNVRLVVTRDLLTSYLILLRCLGIPDTQLKNWTRWFTARDRALFLSDGELVSSDLASILSDAAARGDALWVVTGVAGDDSVAEWGDAAAFPSGRF